MVKKINNLIFLFHIIILQNTVQRIFNIIDIDIKIDSICLNCNDY